ncbi:MAG: iron ABC transporter permease [Chloroflexi bacterium]|nr:iron ABC transporter permease [Chloroflexota bacterium]MDA1174917.1 iron ABC transporter permease [Chloroflexota bacterium]
MANVGAAERKQPSWLAMHQPSKSSVFVGLLVLFLVGYIVYPTLLIVINSFNIAALPQDPFDFGLDNWTTAFTKPGIFTAIWHTVLLWFLYTTISFPVAVLISWSLARLPIPGSYTLEFFFWVSFMMPAIAVATGWIMLMDPYLGFLNKLLIKLPFIDSGPFNIFSIPGIVWVQLMSHAISGKVMLLTPAFRNMDSTMEEASRMAGASTFKTMMKVTLPVMTPILIVVFALNTVRLFESFEIEQLLGTRFNFFVYSTKLFSLLRDDPAEWGQATALGSLTLLIIAILLPLQRWLTGRRNFETITGKFKPGLIDIGRWRWVVFGGIITLVFFLTLAPFLSLVLGSFMNRIGYFQLTPIFTTEHWTFVFDDQQFWDGIKTTLILAFSTAFISPVLFSVFAYILVRTKWRFRGTLESLIWLSAAIPGILSSLGLLWAILGTSIGGFRPFVPIYGTIYSLIIVVVLQGKLTGTTFIKGIFIQLGSELEEASRISGANWIKTYIRVWLPLIMPTLILLGTFNFVLAASTTSSIILLSGVGTKTLSILALELSSPGLGLREEAGVVTIIIIMMTVGVALVARRFGLRLGVRHDARSKDAARQGALEAAETAKAPSAATVS